MEIVRDLFHGMAPVPIEIVFCPDTDADGSNTGYKGQLVKITDIDDIDHGTWCTLATEATAMENLCGILAEDVTSGGSCYMLDSASGNFIRKKIFPITPTTVIRAEYGQKDAAGTATTDTAIYTASASATCVVPTMTTADTMIGGWIYWLTGNNANYLHYVKDNNTTTGATLGTATVATGAASDTCLVICPPLTRLLDFNATYTGLKSEIVQASQSETVQGLDYYVQAPGLSFRKLTRDHDGLYLPGARFFHDFTIPGAAAGANAFAHGVAAA